MNIPEVAKLFIEVQLDTETDRKIKEIINGTNDNGTMEQNETEKKDTL